LHTLYRNTKSKLERLRVKIAQGTSDSGAQLDEQMHTDMMSMVESPHPVRWRVCTQRGPSREFFGRSRRKQCSAIPTRFGGIL